MLCDVAKRPAELQQYYIIHKELCLQVLTVVCYDNINEISRSRKWEQAPLRCKNAHACGLFRMVLCACCRHVVLRW